MFQKIPDNMRITDTIYSEAERISTEYPFVKSFPFGKSVLGRDLICLKIGKGSPCRIFVGTHHAMEYITSFLLLEFAERFSSALRDDKGVGFFGKNEIREIYENHCMFIIPLLNPDGVDIERGDIKKNDAFYETLLKMNGGKSDFSLWQANAHGVDLNHNYDAGFFKSKNIEHEYGIEGPSPTRFAGELPESEPESAALCALTRSLSENLSLAIALHTQGEEIYWDYNGNGSFRSKLMAECFSALSGYEVSTPEGIASYGGYKDWVISSLKIPAFTIECGKGKNPLPHSDFEAIYEKTEHILLSATAF